MAKKEVNWIYAYAAVRVPNSVAEHQHVGGSVDQHDGVDGEAPG
jgi:hypothetical protein